MKLFLKSFRAFTSAATVLLILFFGQTVRAQYFVTNDLQSSFTLLYWTNTSTTSTPTNIFSLQTNTPPSSNYVVSVTTNGPGGLGIEPTNGTMFMLVAWTNMPFGTNLCSSFFTNAMAAIAPAQETVPQWFSILKSYFITGSVPTEQNYWEFVDTLQWYIQSIYTNSVVISSNALYLAGVSPITGGSTFCLSNAAPFFNVISTNGNSGPITGAVGQSGGPGTYTYSGFITNWISPPFSDTNYGFWIANQLDETRQWITVTNITPSNIVFAINNVSASAGVGPAANIHMRLIISK
jgi:hypothetical protein